VKVAVYPSGQWADWIVAASSGVSTDPTWAAHLGAAVRNTEVSSWRRVRRGGHIHHPKLRQRGGPFLKEFVKRKRVSADRLSNRSAERGSRPFRVCWSR